MTMRMVGGSLRRSWNVDRAIILLSFTCLTLGSCSLLNSRLTEQNAYFPLSKGASWIYKGTVKWENPSNPQVMQKELTWKMEVVDTVERDQVTAYVMRGHPADLAWYEEGKKPSDYLILYVKPNRFYQTRISTLEKLSSASHDLNLLVTDEDLILDFPLSPGKKFGPPDQIAHLDNSYCWVVGEEQARTLTGIKGLSPSQVTQEYELSFLTRPDYQVVHFAVGVGITKYVYVHHGTVSEVDLNLIEYKPGTP